MPDQIRLLVVEDVAGGVHRNDGVAENDQVDGVGVFGGAGAGIRPGTARGGEREQIND